MNTTRNLKQEILAKLKAFCEQNHREIDFVPGKTAVKYGGRVYDEKEIINLVDSALEFWLTSGRFSDEFESKFASFLGAQYCSLTNSGSSANLLAISALTSPKLGERALVPGDEVITVAAGFPTTIAPILQNRCVPVFIDIQLPTYNVDCGLLAQAVSNRSRAVILAHTMGNPFAINKIKKICRKYNLWLIEDNCDSLGSKYNNQYTGTFGDIATCSFYPPHHMTMGEGGAVLTNSRELKKIIESFRDWGRDCWCDSGKDDTCQNRFKRQLGELPYGYDHKYTYSHFGFNLKITDMQAAIGCAQLDKLPGFIEARINNYDYLKKRLKKYSDKFIFSEAAPGSEPSWFGFLITVKPAAGFSRDEIVNFLEDNKIQTRMLFAGNMIKHPAFDEMRKAKKGYRVVGDLKNTDYIMNNTFWIGVYPGLNKAMLSYIGEIFDKFMKIY